MDNFLSVCTLDPEQMASLSRLIEVVISGVVDLVQRSLLDFDAVLLSNIQTRREEMDFALVRETLSTGPNEMSSGNPAPRADLAPGADSVPTNYG